MSQVKAYRHTWTRKDKDGKFLNSDNKVVDKLKDAATDAGFFTEPEGKGKPVHSVKSAGGGRYYVYYMTEADAKDNMKSPVMTPAEVEHIQSKWFKHQLADTPKTDENGAPSLDKDGKAEVRMGRLHKALKAIDSIKKAVKTAKMGGYTPNMDQVDIIVGRLTKAVTEVETELLGAADSKVKEVIDL